jgi:tripeptidyl-peptidase-1
VSHPSSSNYGQHLSAEQSQKLLSPSDEARDSVTGWLKGSGAQEITHDNEWIHFKATTKQADSLMNTKFLVYRNVAEENAKTIRTTKVVLPRDIHPHIKMIHPTTRFGGPKPLRSVIHKVIDGVEADGDCQTSVSPSCLKQLYRIPDAPFDASKTGILGVAGFLTQYARFADLSKFIRSQAPWAAGANFSFSTFNGIVISHARNNAKHN